MISKPTFTKPGGERSPHTARDVLRLARWQRKAGMVPLPQMFRIQSARELVPYVLHVSALWAVQEFGTPECAFDALTAALCTDLTAETVQPNSTAHADFLAKVYAAGMVGMDGQACLYCGERFDHDKRNRCPRCRAPWDISELVDD